MSNKNTVNSGRTNGFAVLKEIAMKFLRSELILDSGG